MKNPFKRSRVRLLRVRDTEWTEADARNWSAIVEGDIWQKVRTRVEQVLVCIVLNCETSEDYRRGYMDAVDNINAMGAKPEPEIDDSETLSPIQMGGGATGA